MTLREKYGLLVKRDDVMKKSLSKKHNRLIATEIAIDMYEIHTKIISRTKRAHVLVQYFTNRPGISDESPTPIDQAFKMMLYGDFADVAQDIGKITGCKPDDVLLRAEFKFDGVEIRLGTHMDIGEELEPVVKKMLKLMIPPVIENVMNERNDYIDENGHEDDVIIDKETEKALKTIDWDKTVRGEA